MRWQSNDVCSSGQTVFLVEIVEVKVVWQGKGISFLPLPRAFLFSLLAREQTDWKGKVLLMAVSLYRGIYIKNSMKGAIADFVVNKN